VRVTVGVTVRVTVDVIVNVGVMGAKVGVPVNLASSVATMEVPFGPVVCVCVLVGDGVNVAVFMATVVLSAVGVEVG
jgi:hypothetical protein